MAAFSNFVSIAEISGPARPAQTFVGNTVEVRGERIREAVVTKADGTRVTLVAGGALVAPAETSGSSPTTSRSAAATTIR